MKSFFSKIYTFSVLFISVLCLLFCAALFGFALLHTAYASDMESQVVLFRKDALLPDLLLCALLLLVFFLITHFVCQKPGKRKKILLRAVLLTHTVLGALLIIFGRTMPAADAMSVFSIAESFARGDMSAIHPTASYLSYYPQQIGLAAFYEPILRIWDMLPTNLAGYHLIKVIYVGFVLCIILFQYKTVHLLFASDKADCLYLLLAGTNLPLLFYSSFVYSEIPSFAAMTAGLYYLLFFLTQKKGLGSLLLSVFFLAASVLIRKNSLVVVIAVLAVVLLEWLRQTNKPLLLCYFVLCLLCCVTILPITVRLYELRGNNTLKTGVTATSYFAMGMQEASRGMGWYNGFNFYTYQDTGMDAEKTNAIAKEAIAQRLSYFRAHPAYARDFYRQKFLSQWTDGTYACRQATLANAGGRSPFLISVYEGDYSRILIDWCNLYQNLLYLGALLFCIHALIYRRHLYVWVGLIGVFGGFLFHMLWEANARYILLYSFLLLPYCAAGFAQISNTCFLSKYHKNNTGRRSNAPDKQATANR